MMNATPYQPSDRRPIAARKWSIWQRVADSMATRGVSPNAISVAGMVFGVLAGAALALTHAAHDSTPIVPASGFGGVWLERLAWLGAAVFIQLRLLANLLDGMVAIAAQRASPVGELYNEVPDRVSDTAVLVGLGLATGGDLVLGLVAACAALFTAYVRTTGKAAGTPHDFRGPMAKQQRMALVTALALFCALAPVGWQPISRVDLPGWWPAPTSAGMAHDWGLTAWVLLVIAIGSIVTALRRLRGIAQQLAGSRPSSTGSR